MRKSKLYVDQYGNRFHASTLKELKERHCIPGKVSIMYRDKPKGPPVRVGYVIGQHWLTEYVVNERPA